MKKALLHTLPWALTVIALWVAFRGIDWAVLFEHLYSANLSWIVVAILCTLISYLLRARRWQSLFPGADLGYRDSVRVLILGFFMNNILPARAGEFVRAHLGSKVSGQKRTLVLATIASERLLDGLTLSIMFALFAFSLPDQNMSKNFFSVSLIFLGGGLGVIGVVIFRDRIFTLTEKLAKKLNSKASEYTHDRIHVFIDGLSPLCALNRLPQIVLWSTIIWSIELAVYWSVGKSYGATLTLPHCALFLVAVNFSSLIPAAPGGIGIIEAVGSALLVTFGIPKEQALTLVITQHAIQYLVVGVPGAIFMARSRKVLKEIEESRE